MILYIQSFNFGKTFGSIVILTVSIVFMFIIDKTVTNHRQNLFRNIKVIKKIITINLIADVILGAVIFIVVLYGILRDEIEPLINYKTGNYEITQGYVENFHMENGGYEEAFSVNNIEFSYVNGHDIGYDTIKTDGGVISGNGQHLKIGYYYRRNHGNIIVYIEELT